MPYPADSLTCYEARNVKNKAGFAAHVITLARDTTRLLAFLDHPAGARHKPRGFVTALGKVADLSVAPRLATELVARVTTQRIGWVGH